MFDQLSIYCQKKKKTFFGPATDIDVRDANVSATLQPTKLAYYNFGEPNAFSN